MTLAFVQLGLFEPLTERFSRHPQIPGNFTAAFPAGPRQPNRFRTELRRIGMHVFVDVSSMDTSWGSAPQLYRCPRNSVNSTRCANR